MATKRMDENWTRVKAQIESLWGDADFDEKELKKARGDLRQMVDLIHEKTGESRGEIMQKMSAVI